MNFAARCLRVLMLGLFLSIQVVPLVPPASVAAQTQGLPAARVKELAWEAYRANDYRTALSRVEEALVAGRLSGAALADAWKLKGLCLTDLNRNDEAVDAFEAGLKIDPSITVEGASYIPEEIENFRRAKARLSAPPPAPPAPRPVSLDKKPSSPAWKKWYVLGPVAALLGVVALGALGSSDGGGTGAGTLPGYPEPPR